MAEADGGLAAPMAEGSLRIEPLTEAHREPLRAACAEDPAIWDIYMSNFDGAGFDPSFDTCLGGPRQAAFTIFDGGRAVGMSSYLDIDDGHRTLEIGRTYLAPAVRGTGFNRRVKTLMLGRAFAAGFTRVEFRVDTRNARSMAAVEKLGAVREGIIRRHKITWTGHVRDTALYSILAEEWQAGPLSAD